MNKPGEELLLHEPKDDAKGESIAALVRKMITHHRGRSQSRRIAQDSGAI